MTTVNLGHVKGEQGEFLVLMGDVASLDELKRLHPMGNPNEVYHIVGGAVLLLV